MGLVVAILITLAVLGSVLWVMPSPREKRIIEMRQKAMSMGLKVRLLDQQLAGKFFPWCDDYRRFVLYEKYFQGSNKAKGESFIIRLSDGFEPHELDGEHPFREVLESRGIIDSLPDSTEALVFYSGAVGLLWTEKEGSEAIDQVKACLDVCEELVRSA